MLGEDCPISGAADHHKSQRAGRAKGIGQQAFAFAHLTELSRIKNARMGSNPVARLF